MELPYLCEIPLKNREKSSPNKFHNLMLRRSCCWRLGLSLAATTKDGIPGFRKLRMAPRRGDFLIFGSLKLNAGVLKPREKTRNFTKLISRRVDLYNSKLQSDICCVHYPEFLNALSANTSEDAAALVNRSNAQNRSLFRSPTTGRCSTEKCLNLRDLVSNAGGIFCDTKPPPKKKGSLMLQSNVRCNNARQYTLQEQQLNWKGFTERVQRFDTACKASTVKIMV